MFMQIKRMVFGQEVMIDLTDGEILDAKYEADRYNARELLNERLMQEENIKDELPADLFGRMVDAVVREKDAMDNNMGDNLSPAVNAVIEKYAEELKPYKEEPWGLFEIECKQTRTKTWTIRAKNADDADRIFAEWRENHTREYDEEMADAELDDDIDTAYACEGNPEYADITVE